MRDNRIGAPSLVLESSHRPHREEEKAHREHLHQHNFFHNNKRQTTTDIDVQSVVTEVVQTVSYIQQIDVDPNGSTFSIQTVLADSTGGEYVPSATGASPTTSPEPASPGTSTTASSPASTVVEVSQPDSSSIAQSLLSNQSTTSTSSSVSPIPTTSSFASFTVSSNTTTLISSSSNFTPSFSNCTTTSSLSSSSSFTYLSSSNSSSSSASSSTSSFYSPSYSSSSSATSTGGDGTIAGGTGAATGSSSTSTAAAGNGTNSAESSAPSTSTVVGSVVGSVAGAAILIVVLMMFLRWKKRHQNMLSLGSGDPGPGGGTTREIGPAPSQPTGGMTGPRSSLFTVPGALASLTGFKRSSRQTDQTTSTDAGGERGFYRVSGRKLPSVLRTGGDGYGDEVVDNTLSGSSFYRDSQGFYGGQGSPSLAPPLQTPRPESGIPVMRPSPARTPVTEPGPFAYPTPPAPLTPPLRPDVLGRSHPSQDASHASRFTEEV